jgi:hypothetical protein
VHFATGHIAIRELQIDDVNHWNKGLNEIWTQFGSMFIFIENLDIDAFRAHFLSKTGHLANLMFSDNSCTAGKISD